MNKKFSHLLAMGTLLTVSITGCGHSSNSKNPDVKVSSSSTSDPSMTHSSNSTSPSPNQSHKPTTSTTTAPNGDIVTTTTDAQGHTTVKTVSKNGTTTEKTTNDDGSTVIKTTTKDGVTTIKKIGKDGQTLLNKVVTTPSTSPSAAPTSQKATAQSAKTTRNAGTAHTGTTGNTASTSHNQNHTTTRNQAATQGAVTNSNSTQGSNHYSTQTRVAPITSTTARAAGFRVVIPSLGINSRVIANGATGSVLSPTPGQVQWYSAYSVAPGASGNTVLAGHVTYSGPDVFYNLMKARVGQQIQTTYNGKLQNWQITNIESVNKNTASKMNSIWGSHNGPQLVLVTCDAYSGWENAYHHTNNYIIWASPI